ncbi:putative quinol monooxygenase [Bauldia sp.]|uniref:putative quinol monooxygenase n=1 Tax=Bauldia sp. TaxID=2575872 RepID=UPI003BAAD5DA
MLIAIVDFHVAAEDRQAAIDFLMDEAPAITAMPGNRGHRVVTNAGTDTHVGLIHEWETPDAFAAYLASPVFSRSGETLRPMMTAPPTSRRLVAEPHDDSAA